MSEDRLLFDAGEPIGARAVIVGQRIDIRAIDSSRAIAASPVTVPAGERGYAMVFRYGAVVFFNLTGAEQTSFLESLAPSVRAPYEIPEADALTIRVDPEAPEGVDVSGLLILREASLERLQLVAHALVKSTVLSLYEGRIAGVLDSIEPLAESLRRGMRGPVRGRALLRRIGDVLHAETLTVGRVEVSEKPELIWERPDLDRLYERLSVEYELRERDRALTRKLDLIGRTAETLLDLLQTRRSLHVEWYIVILIVAEIVIMIYQMTVAH
jgi:uncharacterized Rmd1/YagE family protein